MAKIKHVRLEEVPEVINVGDEVTNLTVVTDIEFHHLDLKLEMEYCLQLFVYDIHGTVDAPLIVANWDESAVLSIPSDRKDEFLGFSKQLLIATATNTSLKTPIRLGLGKLNTTSSYHSRKLNVFATMSPAIGRASKWAKPFETEIIF